MLAERPRKQCRECLGVFDLEAGFAHYSDTRIAVSRTSRARCIVCEQEARDAVKERDRWKIKARDTLRRHARKYKMMPVAFSARYSWTVERIAHDLKHAFENTCGYCWKPYAGMPLGIANVTIDIYDRSAEPFYSNTRCCCPTCNTEKGRMTPEQWARRLLVYREHAENKRRLENDRFHSLPLFQMSEAGIPERIAAAAAGFRGRWTLNALKLIDPDLHEALLDQKRLLREAREPGDVEMHGEAMIRGWQTAGRRMEQAEVEKAKRIFPGATVIGVRQKPTD